MSSRRVANNRVRGPQSALTDFLAANNISAAQIRDDYERRRGQADQQPDAGEGPSNAAQEVGGVTRAAAAVEDEVEKEKEKKKKRKRSEKEAIEKIKKNKLRSKKKAKKRNVDGDDDDDDDDYDAGLGREMYKKSRAAPGQFEHCEICSKRFTVTPYSKEGPDGGLLCTPCGKELVKESKAEKKATAKLAGRKRRKIESERLDGIAVGGAKSLVDICLQKVAKHHEDIEELGELPPALLERLSQIFSKKRVMKSKTLPLFLRPDLDAVIVHDAAYLEAHDYHHVCAVVPKLKKLVLGNAGQVKDEVIEYMIKRCHDLRHLQLYAANLVSNDMWQRLFAEAGAKLEVIKLKDLDGTLDDETAARMVDFCPNLNRLKLKRCRLLGEEAVKAFSNITNLQHLSLQFSRDVSNKVLLDLIERRGSALRTLSLERFIDADDTVLRAIHDNCAQLSKLRISENDTATDAGYAALFTTWCNTPLTFIDVNSTRDVDNNNPDGPEEPVGMASAGFKALMAHSGASLKHLDIASCRHIDLGAFIDVFNGAQQYPVLEHINVSFCSKIDTSVIAGIFKSCPALKKLVAFGCFNVQDVVVPRRIALIGVPKAQDFIIQTGSGLDVEEAIGRMVEVCA